MDLPDRLLKLFLTLLVILKDADAKRLERLNNLLAENPECLRSVGCNEDAFSLSQ
jgi:hypothetical protein